MFEIINSIQRERSRSPAMDRLSVTGSALGTVVDSLSVDLTEDEDEAFASGIES